MPVVSAYPHAKLEEARVPAWDLARLRAAYQGGQPVKARLPVELFPEGAGREQGHVDLFLQRTSAPGPRPFRLWQRDDITVPDACRLKGDDILAAMIAPEGAVANFLAAAEPPAHDSWTVTERLRGGAGGTPGKPCH